MSYAEIDNEKFYYEVHGQDDDLIPLVMISGLACTCDVFGLCYSKFKSNRKIIVLDNRGSGRTEASLKNLTIEKMADDINALLDYLNIESVNVLGHSMGGAIAQYFAFKYPQKTENLILVSTCSKTSERNKRYFSYFAQAMKEGISVDTWYNLFLPMIYTENFCNSDDFEGLVSFCTMYPYQQTAEQFKAQVEALSHFDSSSFLSKLTPKTLIISGELDFLIPMSESKKLNKAIPNSSLLLIKNAAHALTVEGVDELIANVEKRIN